MINRARVHDEIIRMRKLTDNNNPSDFLTKWVSLKKLNASVRYATNAGNVVPKP